MTLPTDPNLRLHGFDVPGELPRLRAGDGLPGRMVAFCDGRTTLRASAEAGGFDLLVHYAADSWFGLSRVLSGDTGAMRWIVDDVPHRFEWTESFAFGYINREERSDAGVIRSRGWVEEGAVGWQIEGVRTSARFEIPRACFVTHDRRDPTGDTVLEATRWELGESVADGIWRATRHEAWLFRDSSTYADVMGHKVASEARRSALHLCVASGGPLHVAADAARVTFELAPDAAGTVILVLALDSDAAAAETRARGAAAAPAVVWQRQIARYAAVAQSTPRLEFGRHTALRRFFALEPLYLESMRIRGSPGAYRANNDYYWVWGWDMTRPAFGLLAGNGYAFVRSLLDFVSDAGYINQYDNALTRDLRADGGTPGALEYMLAHDYLAWTGDLAATRRWRDGFVRALDAACANPDATGMTPGAAASTDFPAEFGRTFKAWLAYPTAWQYGGYRAAAKLLQAWGDTALAERVDALAERILGHFDRVFWNDETGFYNEGVHPEDPDLVCDIPLSTALAAMDSPYGEDLYGARLESLARFAAREFLREDGVHIVRRGETRGWKEWTRQPNNWFAANDTMLARLWRSVGDAASLERLFYLYESNFGYQPCAFEGKPFRRPLHTSGSWQAFGAGAWYRNLVEAAVGLWADLGGITLVPCGLEEPVHLSNLRFRDATLDAQASGQGAWPQKVEIDGVALQGTVKLPPLTAGAHTLRIAYGAAAPAGPLLLQAVDAVVRDARVTGGLLEVNLTGQGYTPLAFFSPATPRVRLDGREVDCTWDARSGRGRVRACLRGTHRLAIDSIALRAQ